MAGKKSINGYVVDSVRLGRWVRDQRVCYKNLMNGAKGAGASLINDERIAQLNLIGFDWDSDKEAEIIE